MTEKMDTTKAELVTCKHIMRVSELMGKAARELILRGSVHDASKFTPEELEPLQRMQDLIDKEGQAPYGSEEYKRRTALLGDMIQHHYAQNSHHPEHYIDGVSGMDLFDVIEMAMDWKAASERGEEPSINLSASVARFKIEPQLESILLNTFRRLGWAVK